MVVELLSRAQPGAVPAAALATPDTASTVLLGLGSSAAVAAAAFVDDDGGSAVVVVPDSAANTSALALVVDDMDATGRLAHRIVFSVPPPPTTQPPPIYPSDRYVLPEEDSVALEAVPGNAEPAAAGTEVTEL